MVRLTSYNFLLINQKTRRASNSQLLYHWFIFLGKITTDIRLFFFTILFSFKWYTYNKLNQPESHNTNCTKCVLSKHLCCIGLILVMQLVLSGEKEESPLHFHGATLSTLDGIMICRQRSARLTLKGDLNKLGFLLSHCSLMSRLQLQASDVRELGKMWAALVCKQRDVLLFSAMKWLYIFYPHFFFFNI